MQGLKGPSDSGDQPQHGVDGQRPLVTHRIRERRSEQPGGRAPRHRSLVSLSTTGAVQSPRTRLAAVTSARNPLRNSTLSASSGRITYTATAQPPGVRKRYTRPTLRDPIRATSW